MSTGVIRQSRARWWARVPPRWQVAGVLALPFLLTAIVLRGLTRTMPTYHGGDEFTYHLPTIRQFAAQFPGVDLVDYPAAQTPLYHLLVTVWGELVGMEIWKLRIVGLLASYGVALALYRLLRRHAPLARWTAVGLTLLFVVSPYVYGQSFILVTDNLGLLFTLLALDRFLVFSKERLRLDAFALGCLWIALALLTRQSYVWLGLFGGVWLLSRPGIDRRRIAAGIGLLALAAVPLGALVVAWRGIVPVGGDPASCGLCAPEEGRLGWREVSPLRSPLFTLAVLAVYGPLLFWRPALDGLRGSDRATLRPWLRTALGGLLAGVVLLAVVPLAYDTGDEGWLWRLTRSGPEILGASWLFWLLVPLGSMVAALGVRRNGWRSLPVVLFGTFLVAQLATRLPYQKYFDPFVLLVCLLALRPADLRSWRDALGPAAIVLMAGLYVAAFASGVIAVES